MSFAKALALGSVMAVSATALQAETVLDQTQRTDLSLTLYQNGLGFVRDVRKAKLDGGEQTFVFEDVSRQLTPDSLLISGQGFFVQERRFDFDLLTPPALLEKSVGKTVQFRRFNSVTGKDDLISAKILSAKGLVVIERDGKIEVGQPGRLIVDQLPEGLRAKPALTAKIKGMQTGETSLALAYLSNGLQWHTSYSAEIGVDGKSLVMQSWANLTNTSGVDYNNASLSLAAGQINREHSAPPRLEKMARADTMAMRTMGAAPEMAANAPQALGGLHLYDLGRQVDLKDQETKQVALMAPLSLASERVLVQRFGPTYGQYRGGDQPVHPRVEIRFDNNAEAPLPDGVVRLYRRDQAGELQFVGEDKLARIPRGGEAVLHPGESFDVTLKRTQTDFERAGENSFEAAYQVVIKNARDTKETVRVEEAFPGQWDLEDSSHKAIRENNRAVWKVDVAAGKTQTLTYRVKVRLR